MEKEVFVFITKDNSFGGVYRSGQACLNNLKATYHTDFYAKQIAETTFEVYRDGDNEYVGEVSIHIVDFS